MNRPTTFLKVTALSAIISVLFFQWGCAGPAASKTVKGAGTGTAVGAIGGVLAGQDAGGIAAAGLAGAAIGATIGAIQESKERKRQDTLAQQRAYNQAVAMEKRNIEKQKADLQEELDIAEGFRISNEELAEMEARAEIAEERLKGLQARRNAAIERKKTLEEMIERQREAEREAERLERELAELEGSEPSFTEVSEAPTGDESESKL